MCKTMKHLFVGLSCIPYTSYLYLCTIMNQICAETVFQRSITHKISSPAAYLG